MLGVAHEDFLRFLPALDLALAQFEVLVDVFLLQRRCCGFLESQAREADSLLFRFRLDLGFLSEKRYLSRQPLVQEDAPRLQRAALVPFREDELPGIGLCLRAHLFYELHCHAPLRMIGGMIAALSIAICAETAIIAAAQGDSRP